MCTGVLDGGPQQGLHLLRVLQQEGNPGRHPSGCWGAMNRQGAAPGNSWAVQCGGRRHGALWGEAELQRCPGLRFGAEAVGDSSHHGMLRA